MGPRTAAKKRGDFAPQAFLATTGEGRKFDCGPISNPDGLRNQIEGGVLQGTSRVLGEQITWEDRQVTSIDWQKQHPAAGNSGASHRERSDRPPRSRSTGARETAITLAAAAIGNAIFDATGASIREVPFAPDRVRAALSSRG
jgi:CO/xanthine dehydrogenase Mo-binding subunit